MARSTQQYKARKADDDEALRLALIRLAKQYGRYAKLLRLEGWVVNHKKVERLWREEGLQLPQRHKKRKRLYHKDSSIIRLRPQYRNHIWSVDFVHDKLSSGRPYKMLTVLDEYTREALCVHVRARMGSADVLEALYPLLLKHGKPDHIRSDNVLHSELLAGFGRKASSRSFQIRVLKSITGWASAAMEELAAIANTGSMRVRFAGPYRP